MEIFTPGWIGTLKVKNRVVMAPVSTNLPSAEGEITPEFVSFYKRRAEGGVGLLIIESTNVDFPRGKCGHTQLRIDEDRFVPSLHEFVEIIHEAGSLVALQLNHSGGLYGDRSREAFKPLAPSPKLYGKRLIMAEEATMKEIQEIRDKFIDAAERVAFAGFDAVEIHGGHGYLLAEFLSPWTNDRKDEYGGSTLNRARLAVEIVKGIRKRLGTSYPIIFRISGDEFVEEGRKLSDTIEIVNLLKDAGVNCIHVTAGTHRFPELPARRAQVEPMSYPQGWKTYLAREIRKTCSIKTIAVGVIRDVEVAERIITNGDADFVALGRGLIAEPDWVKKANLGIPIRKCISCNTCIVHRSYHGWKIRCAINSMAGREYQLLEPEYNMTKKKKNIAIIGGGPAGMEAARVASLRGHAVTLYEKNELLGGNLIPAGASKLKEKIRWLNEWLQQELKKNNVNVITGREITTNDLYQFNHYDALVIATGGVPTKERIKIIDSSSQKNGSIIQATDLLAGKILPFVNSKTAAILGGGLIGCETAHFIAEHGIETTIITRRSESDLASDMDVINRYELIDKLNQLKVKILDKTSVVEAGFNYLKVNTKDQEKILSFDMVILAQGMEPYDPFGEEINSKFPEVYRIGDCVKPRNILSAIYEGFSVGNKI